MKGHKRAPAKLNEIISAVNAAIEADAKGLVAMRPKHVINEVRRWRDGLQAIARRESEIPSANARLNWLTGTVEYSRDALTEALDEISDLHYIRECDCGRIYYAPRLTYQGKEIEPREAYP